MKRIYSTIVAITMAAAAAMAQDIHPTPPSVPESLNFAGQTIRFDRVDMYERMDRELITFTYMHTTSTLMLKRTGRYFPVVEPILKEYGIPDDMKYIMVIESNLDPTSVSKAGAAGLWQFMSASGRERGLEVNANIDERYNTEKATRAACRYFKEAYAKYGDWLTVAASYNAGMGGISAKLKSQHQRKATELWLNQETSRYMFRVMAAKMFIEHPENFGFNVTERYSDRRPKEVVTVSDPIEDLVKFAEDHGISYFDLKNANLWLREDKLNNASHRSYDIIIPDLK